MSAVMQNPKPEANYEEIARSYGFADCVSPTYRVRVSAKATLDFDLSFDLFYDWQDVCEYLGLEEPK